jgi:hypothetical protein
MRESASVALNIIAEWIIAVSKSDNSALVEAHGCFLIFTG